MKKFAKWARPMFLVFALALIALVAVGCGNGNGDDNDGPPPTDVEQDVEQPPVDTGNNDGEVVEQPPVSTDWERPATHLRIEHYSQWGGGGGDATGWFAEMVYDKFNMSFHHIDSDGEVIWNTRAAAGNIGELVAYHGPRHLNDLIITGLVQNITYYVDNHMPHYTSQFPIAVEYARNLATELANRPGEIYGLPVGVSMQSVLDPALDGPVIMRGAWMRWDAYYAIGAPTIYTMEDLLWVLEEMLEALPYTTTEDGTQRRTHGITMWNDWDSLSMANAVWFDRMYGRSHHGDLMFTSTTDDTWEYMLEDGSLYHRVLSFYNEAFRRGLIDPDSTTQDWDTAAQKGTDGVPLFSWYSWFGPGGFNTPERMEQGIGYAFVPIMDMVYVVPGMSPVGAEAQIISVGPTIAAEDLGRVTTFLDWMTSPEINQIINTGPQGLAWDMVGGEPVITDFGFEANVHTRMHWDSQLVVPDGFPGAGTAFGDGNSTINIIAINRGREYNPLTGFTYDPRHWPSVVAARAEGNLVEEQWQARFGAPDAMAFAVANNMLSTTIATPDFIRGELGSELETIRSAIEPAMRTNAWLMAFAPTAEAFDSIWEDWKDNFFGLGGQQLLDFFVDEAEEYFVHRAAARAEAMGN